MKLGKEDAIYNKTKFPDFRRFDTVVHALVFLLYEGNYNKMEAGGVPVPRPASQSPKKQGMRLPFIVIPSGYVLTICRPLTRNRL